MGKKILKVTKLVSVGARLQKSRTASAVPQASRSATITKGLVPCVIMDLDVW